MIPAQFPCCPPLSDALLKKYNFFELYPLDGGGCFASLVEIKNCQRKICRKALQLKISFAETKELHAQAEIRFEE